VQPAKRPRHHIEQSSGPRDCLHAQAAICACRRLQSLSISRIDTTLLERGRLLWAALCLALPRALPRLAALQCLEDGGISSALRPNWLSAPELAQHAQAGHAKTGPGLQLLQGRDMYLAAHARLPASLRCLALHYALGPFDGRLPAALQGSQLSELYLTRIADTRFLRGQLSRLLAATPALRVLVLDTHRYSGLPEQVGPCVMSLLCSQQGPPAASCLIVLPC
jgi:hypothetical protein